MGLRVLFIEIGHLERDRVIGLLRNGTDLRTWCSRQLTSIVLEKKILTLKRYSFQLIETPTEPSQLNNKVSQYISNLSGIIIQNNIKNVIE